MNPAQLAAARKRKERANVSSFDSLVASPAIGAFSAPANARLRFVSVAGCAAGTTAATLTGATNRTIKTPLLPAGGAVKLDNVEKDVVVTPAAGFDVELDCGFGVWRKVGGA